MKLIDRTSHLVGHGGKREKEHHGQKDHGYTDHDHGDHGHRDHGCRESHGHEENRNAGGGDSGRVGYPNCPGPGCGNGCSFKGTEKCPKVAAGNASREGSGRHREEHHPESFFHGPMERERILTVLSEEESISQVKLADLLEIRPQSVSELLGKLEADGYILRTQNEQDKRETLISLSEEGKKRAGEVKDLQAKQTAKVLAPLNENERQTLFALLAKLTGETVEK